MLCVDGRGELRTDKLLLVPVTLWDNRAQVYADLFPGDRRLKEDYAKILREKHWLYLADSGFVLHSPLVKEKLDTLDFGQVEEALDENEHKLQALTTVSQIAFLQGGDGVLESLRKSKSKAKRFLQFLLSYIIKADRSWIQTSEVACSCGQKHHVVPAWLFLVKTHAWVPVGRGKGDRASPESVAKLLDVELREAIFKDADCRRFLLKIGISVNDLVRIGVPEEKRLQLDQLSARIYTADTSTIESIEAVLDDPDIQEAVLSKRDEKEKVIRNKAVGTMVEDLLRKELESAGIRVTRTGVGSDFEVESDFIEDDQEQLLEVSHYLLEVKSTSVPFARMTLRQGEEAVKPENQENYVLCVVDVSSGAIDEKVVRDKAKFVFRIGPMVQTKVKDAKGLKDHEDALIPGGGAAAVEIDIDKSSVKLRIKEQVWIEHGVSFQKFVELVKQQTYDSGAPRPS